MTSVRDRGAGRVDVVLGGCTLSLPLVIAIGGRHGKVLVGSWLSVEWDSLAFSARIISTADSSLLVHGILHHDVDLLSTRNAKCVGKGRVGEMKLATLAEETTNRLAGGALHGGPLRLLVTWRTGVGAVRALGTAVTALASATCSSHDVREASRKLRAWALDTSPATKTNPVDFNGTIR